MHAQSLRFAVVQQSWNMGPEGASSRDHDIPPSVAALVFAQAGLRFRTSIEGAKYTRLMP